jgi:hypothetical protein
MQDLAKMKHHFHIFDYLLKPNIKISWIFFGLEFYELKIPPQLKITFLFPVFLGNKILPHSSLKSSHDAHNMNFKLLVAGPFHSAVVLLCPQAQHSF